MHTPLARSPGWAHFAAPMRFWAQPPPQSVSVSSLFRTPSEHKVLSRGPSCAPCARAIPCDLTPFVHGARRARDTAIHGGFTRIIHSVLARGGDTVAELACLARPALIRQIA